MTDVEQLLLSEMRRLSDEVGDMRVAVGRIDERLEHVEARLMPAPAELVETPAQGGGKAKAGIIGAALAAVVTGIIQALVK